MNVNSKLLELFKDKIKNEPVQQSSKVKYNETSLDLISNPKSSFLNNIQHENPILNHEIDFFFLVLMTKDRVILYQNNYFTFPLLAKEMPSKNQISSFIASYNVKNERILIAPELRSAYLVGETKKNGYLKSDVIQSHTIHDVNVHPCVWSFFYYFPEYIGNDILYSVIEPNETDNYVISTLQDKFECFLLKQDAERLNLKGKLREVRLGKVAYLDVVTIDEFELNFNIFIKEYNTADHICIRILQEKNIIPLWIENPHKS
jgi:hypothetical protein